MADFFIDRLYKKVVTEHLLYWDKLLINNEELKQKELVDWIWYTKVMLNNYTPLELDKAYEEAVYQTSQEQNPMELFKEAQKAKVPGRYGKGKARKLIDAKIKISDVAKKYGIEVKKGKAICPFHADSEPSLSFNDEKNVFHCFGCEAKGDVIEFIRRLEEVKDGQKGSN